MKKTIFFKTFWGNLLISILVIILFVLLSINTIKKWHENALVEETSRVAYALSPAIHTIMAETTAERQQNAGDLIRFVTEMGKKIDTRITVISPNGEVLADSLSDKETMENHGDRPEIKGALSGIKRWNFRFSNTINTNMLYLAIPIYEEDTIIGALRLSHTAQSIKLLTQDLKYQILKIAALLLLLSVIITLLISRRISIPIISLSDASKKVTEGQYDIRVFVKDRGELGKLAASFNEMVSQQKNLVDTLTRNREELRTIIKSINEGLVVINTKGDIILANDSFRKITAVNDPENKKYWEVCRIPELSDIIKKVIDGKEDQSTQVEIDGRSYIASLSLISSQERVVITLHDITELQKVEKIKKDFVANVSHELKTPLTSIKGFSETLEDELSGEPKRYLQIIKRNTERMIMIVQDLLLLSEMEENSFKLSRKKLDLGELVRRIAQDFKPVVKKRGLGLRINEEKGISEISGDPSKLEDMLVNLIDNAVKNTEKGEIRINVTAENHNLNLEISDTGIGIAPEHQERIFERFYVVDPSRSKESGGTGLGLAIVKHIVMLHGGTITVTSTPGEGTTFQIRLPSE